MAIAWGSTSMWWWGAPSCWPLLLVGALCPLPFTRSCAARAPCAGGGCIAFIRVAPSPLTPVREPDLLHQQQQQGYDCLLLSAAAAVAQTTVWRVHLAPRSNQGCPRLHQHRANRGLHRLCALVSDERILRLAGAEALGRNAVAQAAPKAEMGSMGEALHNNHPLAWSIVFFAMLAVECIWAVGAPGG